MKALLFIGSAIASLRGKKESPEKLKYVQCHADCALMDFTYQIKACAIPSEPCLRDYVCITRDNETCPID